MKMLGYQTVFVLSIFSKIFKTFLLSFYFHHAVNLSSFLKKQLFKILQISNIFLLSFDFHHAVNLIFFSLINLKTKKWKNDKDFQKTRTKNGKIQEKRNACKNFYYTVKNIM
jgi:predicted MPP superfamily phosphohydrolase